MPRRSPCTPSVTAPSSHSAPTLTPEIVADDGQLAAAVDELLRTDPDLAKLQAGVIAAQARLRAVLDDAEWAAYLGVDEAVGERLAEAVIVIARWAFDEGIRHAVRRPR